MYSSIALPSIFGDQHTNQQRSQKTPHSEHRHGDGVHEREGLLAHSCSASAHDGAIVEVLDVLVWEKVNKNIVPARVRILTLSQVKVK